MSMSHKRVDKGSFDGVMREFMDQEPFFMHLTQQLQVVWDRTGEKIKTASVQVLPNRKIQLLINEEFFLNLPFDEKVGLIWHENLHLILEHLYSAHGFPPDIANVCMDAEINQYIPDRFRPRGACLPHTVKELNNSKDKETFKQYFLDFIENKGDGKKYRNRREHGIADGGDDPQVFDNHDFWNKNQLSKEAQANAIKSTVKVAMQRAARHGKIKNEKLRMLVDKLLAPSKVAWNKILRNSIGSKVSIEEASTRNRPNRKLGYLIPGKKDGDAPDLVIFIDISGSMHSARYEKVCNELKSICEPFKDQIPVFFFADTIFDDKLLIDADIKKVPERPGSGGTNFKPVMDKIKELRPDVAVILTDGECDIPPKPETCHIIWAVCGKDNPHINYGTKILIDDSYDARQ